LCPFFTDPPAFHVFTVVERPEPVLTRGGLKDGSRLVTGSQDTTARIWAVPPGAAAQ
jgi:hypothetical protein